MRSSQLSNRGFLKCRSLRRDGILNLFLGSIWVMIFMMIIFVRNSLIISGVSASYGFLHSSAHRGGAASGRRVVFTV